MTDKKTKEKLKKIKKLLSEKNGVIDEQIKKEIRELTSDRKKEKSVNSTNNLFKSASEFDSNNTIASLSEIQLPDIVKDTIKKTLSSLLDPIRASFMTEIARFIDTISTEEEIVKKIPRAIKQNQIKKIENGKFIIATPDSTEWIVNPEFKQLLSTGYKPKDSIEYQQKINNLSELSDNIGTPESDYIKNKEGKILNNIESIIEEVPGTINKPAALFVNSFNELEKNVFYNINKQYQQVILNGYSNTDKNIKNKKYTPPEQKNKPITPNWTIDYKEQGPRYILNIKNNHEMIINNKITFNTSSYSFVGKLEESLSNNTKKYMKDNKLEECESYLSDELYSFMISSELSNIFEDFDEEVKNSLTDFLQKSHSSTIKSLIRDFFSSYKNNRLLRKFKLPVIKELGLSGDEVEKISNLIIFNLINFIPEASQELIDCGKQPHPLNLDQTIDLMTKKFNSVGVQSVPKVDFCESKILNNEPKNAITESSNLGSALLLTRLIVLENVLKSLFVFDEHDYSQELIMGGLYTDFLYIKVIESLNNLNLYDKIEDIIIENYSFLKQNNIIKDEDEKNNSNIESIRINGQVFKQENLELKYLVKSITRKTIGYLSNLIGTTPATESEKKSALLQLITKNKIYDVLEDQTKPLIEFDDQYFENFRRFKDTNNNNFFILERYVYVNKDILFNKEKLNFSEVKNLEKKYKDINGYISLEKYKQFINSILGEPVGKEDEFKSKIEKLNYIINDFAKIGLRLVQINRSNSSLLPSFVFRDISNSEKIKKVNEKIESGLYEFILEKNQPSIKIKRSAIKQKKMYGSYEVLPDKKTDSIIILFYNSFPLSDVNEELKFSDIVQNNEIVDIQNVFEKRKSQLLNKMVNDAKYDINLNKCLLLNKLPNLANFYSNSALTNSATETLFSTSKRKINDLYEASVNIKNYKHKNSIDKAGGAMAKYQLDVSNIGNPNGGTNFDILQFFITTPILILKGLTKVMDPNIAIASLIVDAAAAGLLFPKFDDEGNVSGYPGDPLIIPTVLASLALLPVGIIPPPFGIGPPVTPLPGMLFWALEPLLWKLPFFQNQAAKSDAAKKLKNDSSFKGLSIGGQDKFKCDIDQDE